MSPRAKEHFAGLRHVAVWLPLLAGAVVAAGLVCAGAAFFSRQRAQIQLRAERELEAIADLKVRQLVNWRRERFSDAASLMHNPLNVLRVEAFLDTPLPADRGDDLRAWLETLRASNDYLDVVLVDRHCEVRLSVGEDRPQIGPYARANIAAVLRMGEPLLSDFHRAENVGIVHLDFYVPLLSPADTPTGQSCIGVLLFRIDPQRFLYPLIQTWPTPSTTAETLLVRRDGDHVLFLNELRHRRGTALNFRLSLKRPNLPAALAVQGIERTFPGTDSRDIQVLAVTRRIPDSPWFLVAKIDEGEVFAAVTLLNRLAGVSLAGFLLIAALAAAWWWTRSRSRFYRQQLEAEIERQQAQARLQQSKADFESLFDSMQEGMALHRLEYGPDGTAEDYTIMEANPAFEKHTGLATDFVVGKRATDAYNSATAPFLDVYARVAETGVPAAFEAYVASLGKHFRVSAYSPRKGQFATVFMDITEQKRVQDEVRQLNAQLEDRVRHRTAQLAAANQELESFSYSVSHDLRTPLRSIDGFSLALLEDCGDRLDEADKSHLTRIRAASQRMGQLIDDLLKLSRITRTAMERISVDVSALAAQIAGDLQREAPHRQVRWEIEPGLTAAADANLLRIALQNLLANAWKFTGAQANARIEVGHLASADCGDTVFFVRDNGAGFDPRYADKLFGAFQRLHTQAEFAGSGIGLATTQRVIHRHGGRIWAESEPGKGATFYYTLPA
jgi:signal transduction histidine kinase